MPVDDREGIVQGAPIAAAIRVKCLIGVVGVGHLAGEGVGAGVEGGQNEGSTVCTLGLRP